MANFAKIDDNNVVLTVLHVDDKDVLNSDGVETESVGQAYLETHNNWPADKWIQCSYNTRGGVHALDGTPFRANYPNIGDKWDSTNSIFHQTQPYESWTLNTTTGLWEAPVTKPDTDCTHSDGTTIKDSYAWNEDNREWVKNTVTY